MDLGRGRGSKDGGKSGGEGKSIEGAFGGSASLHVSRLENNLRGAYIRLLRCLFGVRDEEADITPCFVFVEMCSG